MAAPAKQYGLVLKVKDKDKKSVAVRKAQVFDDDEDDEEQGASHSNPTIRAVRQAERMHEMALAEDPSLFDYDGSYEAIEREKNLKTAEAKKKDALRQSKYAEEIIKSHKRRQLEKFSREERQQQKERQKELDEFADKETFVTGAYRKQIEEVAELRKEEEYEAMFNEATSVQKQMIWQAGISRTLLENISRDGTRKEEEPKKEKKETTPPRKTIYSDDDEPTPSTHFESKLQAGLNRVVKKTKTERLKEAMFTPEHSEEEDSDREVEKEKRRERTPEPKTEKKEKPKVPRKDEETLKRERLAALKKIVERKTCAKEVDEMRKRYFQRRDTNAVPPPF